MQYLLWILASTLLISGCELHNSQELSKHDAREHLRPYVNTPNYLLGNAQLPGNVTYHKLNSSGITAIEHGNEIKLILPVDLFFEENSYEIKSAKLSTIDLISNIIQATEGPVIIIGNTDDIGSSKYKTMQSKKLAEAIKNHLWIGGIEQNRLVTRGAGDLKPISTKSVRGKSLNRRVEIQIRRQSS